MKHVIIAEDDLIVQRSMELLLKESGYRVSAFNNGIETLSFLMDAWKDGGRKPDLLISDVQMPGLTGLELLDKLAESEIEIPALIVTGLKDRQTLVEAMRKRCYDFLDKPWDKTTILNSLENIFIKIEREKTQMI